MTQSRSIPNLEDIVWAELLSGPSIKRLRRNERVIDSFAIHGWITHTTRKDEFTIAPAGRVIAEKRLPEVWPSWREDIAAFVILGLAPEDAGAWSLFRRAQANQIPRRLTHINRRTQNAWERRHSKVGVKAPSKMFESAQITVDEVSRLRLPAGANMSLLDGTTLDCDSFMRVLGEVVIPERAWARIKAITVPKGKVIISVENKGAYVDFPLLPQATLLFLPGDNTSILRHVTARMPGQPIIHFGDLDSAGVDIFLSLVAGGFPIQHFVPSFVEEFVLTHAQPCKTPWTQRDYSKLHPVVSKLASSGFSLEHEALVLDHRFRAELERGIRNAIP